MKYSIKQIESYILQWLCLLVFVLCATPAVADVRQDVESAVAALHENAAALKFPDDMKSLDMVFDVAQRYAMAGETENADKFYLLALQKSRIIEAMLKAAEAPPKPESVDAPPKVESESQQAALDEEKEQISEPVSDRLVGSQGVYTVVKSDTIRLVAAKLGVTQQHLRSMNQLDAKASLKIGQKLAYNNRKIIPHKLKDGIVINIPDRTLYYFQRGALVRSLPVALGSPTKNEKYVWQTPIGKFKITAKVKDPTWTVPPSIQSEMEEQGKEVVTTLPPGPQNPLGKYAIKTSLPGIMIHSTTRPSSIYSFSSHGCVRLSPATMEEFFPQIKVNTRGEIIYKPVKVAVTEDKRVFLEVHQDVYKMSSSLADEARRLIEKQKLSELVDWDKFKAVVKQKSGIAEDISL
jgi:lipoprotein-anchoring transpeptidase ErfK/SrfK